MAKLVEKSSGISGLWLGHMNRIVVNAFIMMMFAYSAKKNKANGPAAYSTL